MLLLSASDEIDHCHVTLDWANHWVKLSSTAQLADTWSNIISDPASTRNPERQHDAVVAPGPGRDLICRTITLLARMMRGPSELLFEVVVRRVIPDPGAV